VLCLRRSFNLKNAPQVYLSVEWTTVILINGTSRQTFLFPADVASASKFYGDFSRILHYLPHIQLVKAYRPDQFRVMYHTLEMNVYRVRIVCDLQVRYNETTQTLHVTPLFDKLPVRSEVTVNSLSAQGTFTSQSVFRAHGEHTSVEYGINLEARLPKPFGLLLLPDRVTQQIAQNITEWRVHEISGGFIKRSIQEYREQAARSLAEASHTAPPELSPAAAVPRPRQPRSEIPPDRSAAS
jgi:hypothetical protein